MFLFNRKIQSTSKKAHERWITLILKSLSALTYGDNFSYLTWLDQNSSVDWMCNKILVAFEVESEIPYYKQIVVNGSGLVNIYTQSLKMLAEYHGEK